MEKYISTEALRKDFIAHHGIKGQKWGVRRYRNEDGSLTEAGKKRYEKDSIKLERKYNAADKKYRKMDKRARQLVDYSQRARWLMDDEKVANKAKRFDRANYKYTKSLRKAENLYNKMKKRYSEETLWSLDQDVVKKGMDLSNRLNIQNSASNVRAMYDPSYRRP